MKFLVRRVYLNTEKVPTARLHVLRSPICKKNRSKVTPSLFFARYKSADAAPSVYHMVPSISKNEAALNPAVSGSEVPSGDVDIINTIPLPSLDTTVSEVASNLNILGEPTLSSLGIGKWYTPPGWLQLLLEYIHVSFNIPWWATICLVVCVARILLFPLVVMSQRNAIHMSNIMPRVQELQAQMTEARITGDMTEAIKASQELGVLMEGGSINPLKSMSGGIIQAPIFVSFFLALRGMTNIPVESMTHGGLWWFTDLTIPDQYFMFPAIVVTTLWITLEVSVHGNVMGTSFLGPYVKYGVKIVPFIVFPFIMNFPNALLVYWGANNFLTLLQVSFLKIPSVRTYFNIEKKIEHEPKKGKGKGFMTDAKQSYANMRITKELEDRKRLDEMAFQKAGRAPPIKTYSYNPTTINTDRTMQSKKL